MATKYMLPPLLPFHLGLFRAGKHFLPGRFFPLAYVLAALGALAANSAVTSLPRCADPS
jgi:hypothetical protein